MAEPLKADPQAMLKALRLFSEPGQVVELRAPEAALGYRTGTIFGFFDYEHLEDCAREAAKIQAPGTYFTVNPVDPDLLARCCNRVKMAGKKDSATSDKDIVRRRLFYIDSDAIRKTGISATDAEKAASWDLAVEVADYLKGQGWPDPVWVDSGNGYHLYYSIDLPADDGLLVDRVLKRLNYLHGDGNKENPANKRVKVDGTVCNAARITKLPGTVVRKGDSTPERPHRMAKLLSVPDTIQTVPASLLEALAPQETTGKTAPASTSNATTGTGASYNVQAFIDRHSLDVTGPKENPDGGKVWEFTDCPFRPGDGSSCAIVQRSNGAVWCGCQHGSCPGSKTTGNHWRELRAKYGDHPSDNNGGVFPEEAPEDPGNDLFDGDPAVSGTSADRVPAVSRLDCIRWSDLRGKPVPPVLYDFAPFMPKIAFGIVAGGSGHGKSLLAIQIAVAVATGLPLFGYPTGAPGGVGILALEDDPNVLHRRIDAAVASYGEEFTEEHHRLLDANLRPQVRTRNPLAYLDPDSLDMALAGLVGEIERDMKTCEAPPALCFIDTFNAVHSGDENSAQETRPLVAAIFGLHARLGCSVWALHHLVKTGTARSAPPITERMDPALVRGSGAIAAGVRGIVQLGWIYPKEAAKAGLETENAARRYAIVGLTKVNDGPLSPWILLEHSANAGLWTPVKNGSAILAKLRGADSVAKSTAADLVLMAVYEASVLGQPFDRKAVAARIFEDHKNPSGSLSTNMGRLATDRLLTADRRGLTGAGLRRVKELLEEDADAA